MEEITLVQKGSIKQLRIRISARLGKPISEEEIEEAIRKYDSMQEDQILAFLYKKKKENQNRVLEWMLSGDSCDYDS